MPQRAKAVAATVMRNEDSIKARSTGAAALAAQKKLEDELQAQRAALSAYQEKLASAEGVKEAMVAKRRVVSTRNFWAQKSAQNRRAMDDRKAPLGARGEEGEEGVAGRGLNAENAAEKAVVRGESKTRADDAQALAATRSR